MSVMRRAASSTYTKKQRKTIEKADELGVCLIGKRVSPSKVVPVGSGGLLKGLFARARENLYIITSGDTFPSKDLSEWQNYILYFQRWDSDKPYDDKLKEYALPDVRKSAEKIEFIEGTLIIPIDPEKLGKGSLLSFMSRCGSSGMLTYRPYPVEFEEYAPGTLAGSFCQIVDGGTSGFSVKTFDLEYMSGKYVLKLPEKGDVFKTRTEVTGGGSLHPRGAVILRRQDQENQRSRAIAVLKFVNDEICPVPLSQISGEYFFHSFELLLLADGLLLGIFFYGGGGGGRGYCLGGIFQILDPENYFTCTKFITYTKSQFLISILVSKTKVRATNQSNKNQQILRLLNK